MEELIRVIGLQWNSDAGARVREQVPGGLWLSKAPQDVLDDGVTYAVFHFLPGTLEETFDSQIDQPVVQFSIFGTDQDELEKTAWRARDTLVKTFDDQLLLMENDSDGNERRMIFARRLTYGQLLPDPDKGWSVTVDYQYMISHN